MRLGHQLESSMLKQLQQGLIAKGKGGLVGGQKSANAEKVYFLQ